jgi:hypothetical protein
MRPVGKLLLRDLWIARATRDCQSCLESPPVQIAGYGNSFTLLATHSETRGGFSPPANFPVHRILHFCPPKFENHCATCRNSGKKSDHTVVGTHSRFTRQG